MTFLTSIFLGLSMGSGALFSIYRGRNDSSSLRSGILHAFILLLSITVLINAVVYAFMERATMGAYARARSKHLL